ncbi:unnamed protein product [Didymodactylos carnosus]|uniref:SET domain-containing protein n=1 Tax=Didymodactylos carnosus TaxID=1234261 RepID=A0A815KTS8_9BILA|nr:unnamed protein product [Didymodactylos carnosus]CAF4292223.1 unnamed protein product [Didymodactylos carnosus]
MPKSHSTLVVQTTIISSSCGCPHRACRSQTCSRLREKVINRMMKHDSLDCNNKDSDQKKAKQNDETTETTHSSLIKFTHKKVDYVLNNLFAADNEIHNLEDRSVSYEQPIARFVILCKHETFRAEMQENLKTHKYFIYRNGLKTQLQSRQICLNSNFSEDILQHNVERLKQATVIKINEMKINTVHKNSVLYCRIVANPVFTQRAVYTVIEDQNGDCLRLALYNWPYIMSTKQIKKIEYIMKCINSLLSMDTNLILLDPWLKVSIDRSFSLRCDSNVNIVMIDYLDKCLNINSINEAKKLGNDAYSVDDNLRAIDYYSFGLEMIKSRKTNLSIMIMVEQMKQMFQEHFPFKSVQSPTLKSVVQFDDKDEVRLLSNRSICYLNEHHYDLVTKDCLDALKRYRGSGIVESTLTQTEFQIDDIFAKCLYRLICSLICLNSLNQAEIILKKWKYILKPESLNIYNQRFEIIEHELIRLKEELKGNYNLENIFQQSNNLLINTNEKRQQTSVFYIEHIHAQFQRHDYFEIRPCTQDEIVKNGYDKYSYGVYAKRNIEPGTLLLVEQAFSSVDVYSLKYYLDNEISLSLNIIETSKQQTSSSSISWNNDKHVHIYSDQTIRLINEIEKHLLISRTNSTFNKIKLIQPIRKYLQKLKEDSQENETNDNSTILQEKESLDDSPTTTCSNPLYIPWKLIFEAQERNPFKTKNIIGWWPTAQMINHSCLPNCIWFIVDCYLFIYVCSTGVKQGEELKINYGQLWDTSYTNRSYQLRQFGIKECQCSLCIYDRTNLNEIQNELKKFNNYRTLCLQQNISNQKRFQYYKCLKEIYVKMCEKFHQRPIGFVNEIVLLQQITNLLEIEDENDGEIYKYVRTEWNEQLQYLLKETRYKESKRNPLYFYGLHTKFLCHYYNLFNTDLSLNESQRWLKTIERLTSVYTFKSSSSQKLTAVQLNDKYMDYLISTQTCFITKNRNGYRSLTCTCDNGHIRCGECSKKKNEKDENCDI